jgi:hypothetical protein
MYCLREMIRRRDNWIKYMNCWEGYVIMNGLKLKVLGIMSSWGRGRRFRLDRDCKGM